MGSSWTPLIHLKLSQQSEWAEWGITWLDSYHLWTRTGTRVRERATARVCLFTVSILSTLSSPQSGYCPLNISVFSTQCRFPSHLRGPFPVTWAGLFCSWPLLWPLASSLSHFSLFGPWPKLQSSNYMWVTFKFTSPDQTFSLISKCMIEKVTYYRSFRYTKDSLDSALCVLLKSNWRSSYHEPCPFMTFLLSVNSQNLPCSFLSQDAWCMMLCLLC